MAIGLDCVACNTDAFWYQFEPKGRPHEMAATRGVSSVREDCSAWEGRLFLAPGMFLYLGRGASAAAHAHHAVQLVWAKNRELTLQLPTGVRHARATLIPANLEHALEATDQVVALVLVEPHGARGAGLDARAKELVGTDITHHLAALSFPSGDIGGDEALAWCDALMNALAPTGPAARLSRATARAIDYVEAGLGGVPRLAEAARLVGLSPTRLTHQFSAEVGIPFRRFVLWARMKRAVEATRRGLNTTDVAMEAGFSDGAHLARTFRAMFGLSPSMLLPRIEIVGNAWQDRM
jgi:AraC-like DNA-binding protein